MNPPAEIDGRPVLAFAEVPNELTDEYEMTIVATGETEVIAALAIIDDVGTDDSGGFLVVELDPTMKRLEDWWFESVDEAIGNYPDWRWKRLDDE